MIGIVIGSLVVDAVGNHAHWTIAVVLVSFFLGMYLMRINYTFFVIAITIVVSQLYQELHVFSNNLLLWRLAETALGAVITILVVTFVLPLRSRRVLRVAFRNHVRAIGTLVDHASGVLTSEGPASRSGRTARRRPGRRRLLSGSGGHRPTPEPWLLRRRRRGDGPGRPLGHGLPELQPGPGG